tara:strand:- start:17100 stop:17765 length:666 start_codon:yes stop_codon:yes gene_type:complete
MSVQGVIKPDSMGRVRREISIQRLLEWAFADECAQVDFEDPGRLVQGYWPTGNAYRMAQRGVLGCRIDGGGRSDPDPDADLVASAVATLPERCGGRRMAVAMAEYARARRVPDCMADARIECVVTDWTSNRYGRRAKTERIGTEIEIRGKRRVSVPVLICPISFSPTQAQIGAARRAYLAWYGALLELRGTFQAHQNLSRWKVTSAMPVMRPWTKEGAKRS